MINMRPFPFQWTLFDCWKEKKLTKKKKKKKKRKLLSQVQKHFTFSIYTNLLVSTERGHIIQRGLYQQMVS